MKGRRSDSVDLGPKPQPVMERKPYEEAHKRTEAASRIIAAKTDADIDLSDAPKWWTRAARKSENSTGFRESR
jgi:hypothetical protein